MIEENVTHIAMQINNAAEQLKSSKSDQVILGLGFCLNNKQNLQTLTSAIKNIQAGLIAAKVAAEKPMPSMFDSQEIQYNTQGEDT